VLVVAGITGCDREERGYRVNPPAATPADAVRLVDLVPGPPSTQPMTQPSTPTLANVENKYESNAYAMAEGQRLYAAYNCTGCHANGGGGMGPALMDDNWAYGHRPGQVYSSIVQGRPNGMPSWGGRIPDHQVWQLVAFVRSMSGQARTDAAPGRSDHMRSAPAPNTIDPADPKDATPSKSAEMPQ
jgi:cytochrome c oxidase cbb3-type subunit 3